MTDWAPPLQGLEEAVKKMFPSDDEVQEEHEGEEGSRFFVRITDLPLQDKLRELRCEGAPRIHSLAERPVMRRNAPGLGWARLG